MVLAFIVRTTPREFSVEIAIEVCQGINFRFLNSSSKMARMS